MGGRDSNDKTKANLVLLTLGHGILEALASSGMGPLLDSTSITDGILGAWERPARKTASPRLELGGGGRWAPNGVLYQDASWVAAQQRRRIQPVGDGPPQDLTIEPMGHHV